MYLEANDPPPTIPPGGDPTAPAKKPKKPKR